MLEITIAGKIIRIENYIWTKAAKYIRNCSCDCNTLYFIPAVKGSKFNGTTFSLFSEEV